VPKPKKSAIHQTPSKQEQLEVFASEIHSPLLEIVQAENLAWLREQPPASFDLIYVDPPFNTGRRQRLRRRKSRRVEGQSGDQVGFGGQSYRSTLLDERSYGDTHGNYLGFLRERFEAAVLLLTSSASLFVHIDPRESHYVKVMLDEVLGRECFMNEIVWAYDYGGRSRRRWSPKHDVILWYARDPDDYIYNYEAIDRVPYMAPKLVGPEKARRGKTPTDVWWKTIVSPTGKERTGYPTQKPIAILERIVRVHSDPGARVLDFFAGSGTTGEAAWRNGRSAVLVDENPEAIEVMERRLGAAGAPIRVAKPQEAINETIQRGRHLDAERTGE
jgi:site-specific DNA-methyltransferase (adenine-specific)